jgi:hypothetical protein
MHEDELTNSGKHAHSSDAYKILDDHYIGTVLPALASEIDDTNPLVEKASETSVQADCAFELGYKKKVSQNLVILRLQNLAFKQRLNLKGVKWMGRHYYLGIPLSNNFKPYTQVVSLSNEAIEYRESLIRLFEMREDTNVRMEAESDKLQLPHFTNELTFAIKPYGLRPNAVSQKLVSVSESSEISLKGPFGQGLGLTSDFDGRSVIITLGTGVLPFLDLFDFLLKKATYLVFKDEGLNELSQVISPQQDYDHIMKNASFEFYGSFNHSQDFIGAEWISKLESISKRFNLGLFSSQISVHTEVEGPTQKFEKIPGKKINPKFLREKILLSKEKLQSLNVRPDATAKNSKNVNLEALRLSRDVDRVYLCGPSNFLAETSSDLIQMGFPQGRIYYV